MTTIQQNTQAQVESMLKIGMKRMSSSELHSSIDQLGYSIDKDCDHKYINHGNEISYLAYSLCFKEKDTQLSFCNIDARKDENFRKLQDIRRECFVYEKNRVWEL